MATKKQKIRMTGLDGAIELSFQGKDGKVPSRLFCRVESHDAGVIKVTCGPANDDTRESLADASDDEMEGVEGTDDEADGSDAGEDAAEAANSDAETEPLHDRKTAKGK